MAGTDSLLFKIDAIVVAGVPVAFEDGSGSLVGVAAFSNTVVPSANGDDYESRKRVTRQLKARLQFAAATDADALTKIRGAQITARDTASGKRALLNNCSFADMGDVGSGGGVDVTFNILAPVQWL